MLWVRCAERAIAELHTCGITGPARFGPAVLKGPFPSRTPVASLGPLDAKVAGATAGGKSLWVYAIVIL